jgi:ligand-binding sensor domain-containing protein
MAIHANDISTFKLFQIINIWHNCNFHKCLKFFCNDIRKYKCLYIVFLFVIFFTSCNRHSQTNKVKYQENSAIKKQQYPKIVRTLGAQYENVVCQLLDKNGYLWFSITGEGAYRYDGKSFINFTMKDGLCNNDVGSIIQDKSGNILFGTNSGICSYDGLKFAKYPLPDTFNVICMLEDKAGNLWFSAMNKGVYRYDGKNLTNFIYKYDHPKFGDMREKMVIDIFQDTKGNIWFSSWNRGGVWRYDGNILSHFLPSIDYYTFFEDERSNANSFSSTQYEHTPDYITDDMIFSISEDKAGNIWFATRRHGACRYDGKAFSSFGAKEGLLSIGTYSILEDKKGNLWFTTEKDGVWCYDGKSIKNYNEKNGLINNSVMNILEDNKGNLWFGTRFFGLSKYDGKSFITFSEHGN